jgi:YtkA-like protein
MRKLLIGLTLVALAMPAAALAGGWATVGVPRPPDDMGPGDTWNANITVLQHGNPETPLTDVSPTLTIRSGAKEKTFKATPTDKPGVYVAKVVFPSAGKWSYEVYDGFVTYGGQTTHTFAPVTIGAGSGSGGFPTLTVGAALVALMGLAFVLWLLLRRIRIRAPAPTH